mgnify:CR=1 FL=1
MKSITISSLGHDDSSCLEPENRKPCLTMQYVFKHYKLNGIDKIEIENKKKVNILCEASTIDIDLRKQKNAFKIVGKSDSNTKLFQYPKMIECSLKIIGVTGKSVVIKFSNIHFRE